MFRETLTKKMTLRQNINMISYVPGNIDKENDVAAKH